MALKAIMLRKKLNDAQKALDALREKDADIWYGIRDSADKQPWTRLSH